MQNIIEILNGMNITLTDEQAADLNKKVAANYKTIAEFDKKISGLEGERDNFKTQLETAQTTLKGFEGVDVQDIQKQIADWKKKAEDTEAEYKKQIAERDFADALKGELDKIKFTSVMARNAVTARITAAGLKQENGKILGLSDLIETIKAEDADAFAKDGEGEKQKARFTNPKQASSGGTKYSTKDEILKIKNASERQKAIQENIELFTN